MTSKKKEERKLLANEYIVYKQKGNEIFAVKNDKNKKLKDKKEKQVEKLKETTN